MKSFRDFFKHKDSENGAHKHFSSALTHGGIPHKVSGTTIHIAKEHGDKLDHVLKSHYRHQNNTFGDHKPAGHKGPFHSGGYGDTNEANFHSKSGPKHSVLISHDSKQITVHTIDGHRSVD